MQPFAERAARPPARPSHPRPHQVKDRHLVAQRMRAHVHNPGATPLLIFPEGT
jgi:hypothetical protein